MAEAKVLNTFQCGFESHQTHGRELNWLHEQIKKYTEFYDLIPEI